MAHQLHCCYTQLGHILRLTELHSNMRWSSAWTALASRRGQLVFNSKKIVSNTSNITPTRYYSDRASVTIDTTNSGKPIVTESADILKDAELKTSDSFSSPPSSISKTSQSFEDQLKAITGNFAEQQKKGTDTIVTETSSSALNAKARAQSLMDEQDDYSSNETKANDYFDKRLQRSHSFDDYGNQPDRRNSRFSDQENRPQQRGRSYRRSASDSPSFLNDEDEDDDGFYQGRGSRFDNFSSGGRRSGKWDIDDILESADRDTNVDEEDSIPLPSLKKNFFQPDHRLLDRSEKDNLDYLRKHSITIIRPNSKSAKASLPPAIQNFADYTFPASISRHLEQYTAPTPIQAQGWSVALSGGDLVGVGQTGSGKTLAYLLPALIHIQQYLNTDVLRQRGRHFNTPSALVLAPTRELVQQIMAVAMEYGPAMGVKSVAMFGGAAKSHQLNMLQRGAELVVATPGRLLDFSTSGALSLRKCSFLVLDEADRMLDMGFEPQIRAIVKRTREDRQTLMWSATWPEEVQDLALSFLTDHIQMNVGSTELQANPDIEQIIHICDNFEKSDMLLELIMEMTQQNKNNRAMVFCQTKRQVDIVTRNLWRSKISAEAIHGDKTQQMRDRALNGFRNGRYTILVATDVAARGLDIPEVTCVVNFDYPNDAEDYVHRIGRTGRCGNKGIAHTFFTKDDAAQASKLVKVLRHAGQEVNAELQKMANSVASAKKSYGRRGGGGGGRGRGSYGGNYGMDRSWDDRSWQSGRNRNNDRGYDNNRHRNRNNTRRQEYDW